MATESQHQMMVIKWTEQPFIRNKYPELKLMYHIPNERKCTPIQGAQLKRMGVRSGVPDLCLPVARDKFHGLYIEMKTPEGRTSDTQKWWIEQLLVQGYMVQVAKGWKQAVDAIEWYLGLKGK